MKLVITEKPSVAMSIAKVIGAGERRDGWMEGGGYLVSWCIGHLVELSPPESYDEKDVHPVDTGRTSSAWRENATPLIASENSPSRIFFAEQPPSGGCSRGRYGKWRYEDLPILPQDWQYQVSASTRKQFTVLKKLMERQDVTSLVCATVARRQWRLFGNDRSGEQGARVS